jgi:hypothetical protein
MVRSLISEWFKEAVSPYKARNPAILLGVDRINAKFCATAYEQANLSKKHLDASEVLFSSLFLKSVKTKESDN